MNNRIDKTYTPTPADTSDIQIPADIESLTEALAENTHDVWAAGRIKQGWTYGPTRNDTTKETPCLVPYADLPDSEKAYDRMTAQETIKLILKLGYRITKE